MQFAIRRRRRPPTVIMVPLIDILLALLMFMVATSTFKRQPAIRLTLPVSREAKASPAEPRTLTIQIDKAPPYFYLGKRAVSPKELEAALKAAALADPETAVAIRADRQAPWGEVVEK